MPTRFVNKGRYFAIAETGGSLTDISDYIFGDDMPAATEILEKKIGNRTVTDRGLKRNSISIRMNDDTSGTIRALWRTMLAASDEADFEWHAEYGAATAITASNYKVTGTVTLPDLPDGSDVGSYVDIEVELVSSGGDFTVAVS